ncbi:MAG TPA: class I SAM-dependent methyltransferase [Vicinamibacterales bacterium]|nr:class I SAM-dependent methyltransferase [Vicinamibacterales bacterium]
MAVALRRAAHQLLDSPVVFDDPLALSIVGPEGLARLRDGQAKHRERFSVALRAFVVARARATEEALARAVDRGVSQFVVLGAGLDTFAYRNPYNTVRVFEVDHPATQEWKRGLLSAAGIARPASMTFAPVDFEHQRLVDGLASAGMDLQAPALFSWLGVTMYLTADAFSSTLDFIAARPPASGVVFDYAVARESLGWTERLALSMLEKRVAAAGEPFRTFFSPAALHQRLLESGFTTIEDLAGDDLNVRYFANRTDRLRVTGGMGRLATAWR